MESGILSGQLCLLQPSLMGGQWLDSEGGHTDARASPLALVTVPSMGYAPVPAPTSLQLQQPQQPVTVVQEVRLAGAGSYAPQPGT